MNCEEVKDTLLLMTTGEASSDEVREVEIHCASCASCAEQRAVQEELWAALKERKRPSPSPELCSRVRSCAPGASWQQLRFMRVLRVAAAIVLVAGVGVLYHLLSGTVRPGHPRQTLGGGGLQADGFQARRHVARVRKVLALARPGRRSPRGLRTEWRLLVSRKRVRRIPSLKSLHSLSRPSRRRGFYLRSLDRS